MSAKNNDLKTKNLDELSDEDVREFAEIGSGDNLVWGGGADADLKKMFVMLWEPFDTIVRHFPQIPSAVKKWRRTRPSSKCEINCVKFGEIREALFEKFDLIEEIDLGEKLGSFFCYSNSKSDPLDKQHAFEYMLDEFLPKNLKSRVEYREIEKLSAKIAILTEAVWVAEFENESRSFTVVLPIYVSHSLVEFNKLQTIRNTWEISKVKSSDGPRLKAILGESSIRLDDLKNVTVGDLVILNQAPSGPIALEIDGKVFGEGFVVVANDNVAIRVSKISSATEKKAV